MSSYILSTANRFYGAVESNLGQVAPVTPGNRMVGSRFRATQVVAPPMRRDRTGYRSLPSPTALGLQTTAFEFRSFMTSNSASALPMCDPLFRAALGDTPATTSGLTLAAVPNGAALQTITVHNLTIGSAVSFAGEIRFVIGVPNASSLILNAPFSNTATVGAQLATTATYGLTNVLPSVSIYEYWDPSDTISRVLTGAVVNEFELVISGGNHELAFVGSASNLLDNTTFASGTAGLSSFPLEPTVSEFDYSIVPAGLGQVWLGTGPSQFFTLLDANVRVVNNIQARNREFGTAYSLGSVPGRRQVLADFSLLAQDGAQTTALYEIAKQRGTISALLQLGVQQGALMAVFLPNVTPEIPEFDDSSSRVAWRFVNNRSGGVTNNEIALAFA